MKLTIAIPNYNGGNNLKEAIESCRHVNLPINEFEILVLDNQSTDDSINITKKLSNQFSNIRLWENLLNVGRIGNWNIALEKSEGDFLILLFTNDRIYEKNNIRKIIDILEENQNISLSISALIKKEEKIEMVKKKYFEQVVLCNSKGFSNDSISRGLFPFGTIESIIYRLKDIKENKFHFLEEFPINADEIFSYNLAINRENILFNPIPQIVWDLTKQRFHGTINYEDEEFEHVKTIQVIGTISKININFKLVRMYRLLNFIKYEFHKRNSPLKLILIIFNNIIKGNFVIDRILFKSFFQKILSTKDSDDIIFKNLILKWKFNLE